MDFVLDRHCLDIDTVELTAAARAGDRERSRFEQLFAAALSRIGEIAADWISRGLSETRVDARFTEIDARIVDARTGEVRRAVDGVSASLADSIQGIQRLRQRVTAAVAVELDEFVGSLGLGASEPPTYAAYLE
jgi:hypothetical protein